MSESIAKREVGTPQVKRGMAQMLKGGVIMDVVTPEQGKDCRGRWRSRRYGT